MSEMDNIAYPNPSSAAHYAKVRAHTEALSTALSAEDQCVQSMPDASPTKWHRAHITWFFEQFVLTAFVPSYRVFDPDFGFLFNSYYDAVGARHPRPMRGLLTRPPSARIAAYRAHVDAAMAGSAMILPECRWMWAGIEGADSLVINLHKWLGVPFDCSLYFVRDPEHLVRVMSTNPSYLQSAVDGQVKNLRDWGIPLGRRFRALKLWFVLREQGVEALQARLRRDLAHAQSLAAMVAATPGWQVLAPVRLQTVCVRYTPDGLDGAALDAFTQGWAAAINQSGAAYLTPAVLDGRWMVRVSIGAVTTEAADIAAVWQAMREAVACC